MPYLFYTVNLKLLLLCDRFQNDSFEKMPQLPRWCFRNTEHKQEDLGEFVRMDVYPEHYQCKEYLSIYIIIRKAKYVAEMGNKEHVK